MNGSHITKIVWLVDIHSTDRNAQLASVPWLKILQQKTSAKIEPVYILPPAMSPLGIPKNINKLNERSGENWRAFEKWLRPIKGLDLLPPVLLFCRELYLRSNVDALNRYLKDEKVDLVVLNTHARKGLGRFWLGSFAETLLLHCKVPLFLINPFCKHPKKLSQVFCPVQLDKHSEKTRKPLVQFASALDVKLHLFHKVEHRFESFGYPSLVTTKYKRQLKVYVQSKEKDLKEWQNFFRKQGVQSTFSVDISPKSVTESILQQAKVKKSGMIALHSNTGAFASAIMGSTTRNVVRQASCPVWVFPL